MNLLLNASSDHNERFNFILILCIVYVSDDTVLFGTNADAFFSSFIRYTTLYSILFTLLLKQRRIVCNYALKICIVMCIMVLLSKTVNQDDRLGYYHKCAILMLSYLISQRIDFETYAINYEKILYFFSLCSLVCIVLIFFNKNVLYLFPTFYNTVHIKFYNLFVYCYSEMLLLVRNAGIFREPGVFQMFIMLSMLFYVYFSETFTRFHFTVYTLTLFSTLSTTAYIAYLFFIVLLVEKKTEKVYYHRYLSIIFVTFIIVLVIISTTDILSLDGPVLGKFQRIRGGSSGTARISSIVSNIIIWLSYPLFGAGTSNTVNLFAKYTRQLFFSNTRAITNTIFYELAVYGIFYTCIMCIGFIKFTKYFSKRRIERILITIILVVLASGEDFTYDPAVYVLMFYGFKSRKKYDFIGHSQSIDFEHSESQRNKMYDN